MAIAGAAALWAAAATLARSLFDAGVDPLHLAASRSVVTFAGLLAVPAARARPPATTRRKDLGLLATLGLSIAAVNAVYYVSIQRLSVAVAIVIQYTAPAMVVAWTALTTRTRPSGAILGSLAAAVLGVALVSELFSGELGRLDLFGLAMAGMSAVLFATYTLLSQEAGASYGALPALLRAFSIAAAAWVIVLAPAGPPRDLLVLERAPAIVFIGLGGTLAPFFLYLWGVGHVRAERASIAASLEPVLAALFAWALLGQSLSAQQLAGGALVVAAVAALQVKRHRVVLAPEP
jgi:DME family drug/metabolite transporter